MPSLRDSGGAAAAEAKRLLQDLESTYRKTGRPIGVKFRDLCSPWLWAKRSDVYTHLLHPYSAKMLPYIPILFLSSDQYFQPEDVLLDPFAGTGTVLLESSIHPYLPRTAFGIEINPLARLIAKVKVTPIDPSVLPTLARDIAAIAATKVCAEVPAYKRLDYWFTTKAQQALGRLRTAIDGYVKEPHHRDFFRVCLAATVRRCSFADPDIPPPVHLNPAKYPENSRHRQTAEKQLSSILSHNQIEVFLGVCGRNIERMNHFWQAWRSHASPKLASMVWDDATSIRFGILGENGAIQAAGARDFPDGSCGGIITSPPYGTAQKYVRNTKLEMLWLGLIREDDIRRLERQTIGTEKASKGEYSEIPLLGVALIDDAINAVKNHSAYRASLTYKYFQGIKQAVAEASRVLRPGGHFLVVVGDNIVSGVPVHNHKLIVAIAEEYQLELKLILHDRLDSRSMITTRHQTGGLVTDDWVLVLRKRD